MALTMNCETPQTIVNLETWPDNSFLTLKGSIMGTTVNISVGNERFDIDARSLASALATIKPDAGICVVPKMS